MFVSKELCPEEQMLKELRNMEVKMSLEEFKKQMADRSVTIYESDSAVCAHIGTMGILAEKPNKKRVFKDSIKVEKIGVVGVTSI